LRCNEREAFPGYSLLAMYPVLAKLLFAGIATAFWDEVVRPDMVTADASLESRRSGDPRPTVKWHGPAVPLPFFTNQLSAIVLVDAVERAQDPLALLDEAHRVAERVYVVTPHLWTPTAWIDPRNRWVRVGTKLFAVPGRKAPPVQIPAGLVASRHMNPVDSFRHAVEGGLEGWLS
jgi:hypothetical protein